MRLHQSFRARIAIIAATVGLVSSVSAFGQQVSGSGQPGAPSLSLAIQTAAQNAAQQPGEPVRRISIDEAVKLAMEQNLGIRIQRFDPQIQDTGVFLARSAWAPAFTSTLSKNSNQSPNASLLSGTQASVTTGTFAAGASLAQQLPFHGANYTVNWNNSRFTSTDPSNIFNPRLSSNVQAIFQQPLLRNFSIDQIRQQVAVSKKVRDLSDINLESVVTQTLRNVRNAYWDLSYAINNLKAQQESLALSKQSLKDNQKRVEIGTMAPIDIVQAQAEVANNESNVIVAEAAIKQAQDALRALILDPASPDVWNVVFEPTDAPSFDARPIDLDAAVRNALDKRSDVRGAKNALEQSDINIKYYNNQIKPDVNAQVTYGAVGIAGTQAVGGRDPLTGLATPVEFVARSFGSALGDAFSNAYPQWAVGVQIGYPFGANTAHANLARVRLEYEQAQAQLKNMEMQVTTQVRSAARNVQSSQQLVQSARASRELQEKKLEAEEKKLAAGMSSPFFVVQAQRDLSLSRTVEIRAISDYNKALVDFEAVQQVPINGGGAFVQVAR
jgi:outer membrane protein TolC